MERLHCDWLPPKVGQEWRRSRLVDIFKNYVLFTFTLEAKISITFKPRETVSPIFSRLESPDVETRFRKA